MSCSVTSVFTFKIESTFDEWAAIFDSAEADKRHSEFDIKPLFRGVSKEDPQKIIVIHQAPEGNVQKFVEANGDWMATHRVDLSTMHESSWTSSLTKDSCCDSQMKRSLLTGLSLITNFLAINLLRPNLNEYTLRLLQDIN